MANEEILKVVKVPLKVDLHIHSVYSRGKDSSIVADNTLDNIQTLIDKLNEYQINMCAITDHDNFNYALYSKLKKEENKEHILKVLPGIEFSVKIENIDNEDKELKQVHIVVIFDDSNDEKISKIEEKLKKYAYTEGTYYDEATFLKILSDIDINVVMIAHQKGSITSKKPRINDAINVGENRFNEFVFSGYFEAYEFRNSRNEIFNNVYKVSNELEEQVRFITASDCHVWENYPNGDEGETGELMFTHLKCLPTFKGLAMALTDHSRIRLNDNFFTVNNNSYIENIMLNIDGEEVEIPMSKGINVIIGDNSIGKSMFIHSLTDHQYIEQLPTKKLKEKYIEYLNSNNIELLTNIPQSQIFEFDSQDEVRRKFNDGKLESNSFFEGKYPPSIPTTIHKDKIIEYFNSVFADIKRNIDIHETIHKLQTITIPSIEIQPKSLTITKINGNYNGNIKDITAVINQIDRLVESNNNLLKIQNSNFTEEEINKINEYSEFLESLSKMRSDQVDMYKFLNRKINTIDVVLDEVKTNINSVKESNESVFTEFTTDSTAFANSLLGVKNILTENHMPRQTSFNEIVLKPNTNPYDKYNFVTKVNEDSITFDMLEKWLADLFMKDTDINNINSTIKLKSLIKRYDDNSGDPFVFLKLKVENKINEALKEKKIINFGDTDDDVKRELSQGFNSKIYFDILSFDEYKKGIYIIDQPEDNVSQKAIKNDLLRNFTEMAKRRQIIIVTHNPQFVVNLDVDNVIFLSKVQIDNTTDQIMVYSGALEFECDEYSILSVIEENLDGGLETIKKRWRRYDKNRT